MAKNIERIIFDFGGVLMHGEIEEITPYLADKYEVGAKAFEVNVLNDWLKAMVNPGHDRTFWMLTAKQLGIPVKDLFAEFMAFPRLQTDVVEIVRGLHRRYSLAMLTDQIRSWHVPLMAQFHLNGLFDPVVTSYGEHLAKPDPRMFSRLIERLSADPKECLLIDDRQENIAQAKALGVTAIRFRDADQLRAELEQKGITL
jgi:epoxide hydrolase-like predicted phosphatase